MPRRNELGNIASGLIGSFSSRNNDVSGYWGIGKLFKLVESSSEKVVSIELVERTMAPDHSEFGSLLDQFNLKLKKHLAARNIDPSWVVSATITASFDVDFQDHHKWRSALGKPYVLECDIEDDKGRHHKAYAYNNARPHDPKKEMRSSRADNF